MGSSDQIRSALCTPCVPFDAPNRVGMSHWSGVVTVYTETGESYLVRGYNNKTPFLSACSHVEPVDIANIYEVIQRDHPAIVALRVTHDSHTHYTNGAIA